MRMGASGASWLVSEGAASGRQLLFRGCLWRFFPFHHPTHPSQPFRRRGIACHTALTDSCKTLPYMAPANPDSFISRTYFSQVAAYCARRDCRKHSARFQQVPLSRCAWIAYPGCGKEAPHNGACQAPCFQLCAWKRCRIRIFRNERHHQHPTNTLGHRPLCYRRRNRPSGISGTASYSSCKHRSVSRLPLCLNLFDPFHFRADLELVYFPNLRTAGFAPALEAPLAYALR